MKKRVVKLIVFVLFLAFIVFTLTKIYKTKKEERESYIRSANSEYRECLAIMGACTSDERGVTYSDKKGINIGTLYEKIAFVRVFYPQYQIEYDSIDELLSEYDNFCKTGKRQDKLDLFCSAYEEAIFQADSFHMSYQDMSAIIYELGIGCIVIEDGRVAQKSDMNLVDLSDEQILDACKYFEKYSDVIIDWWMEFKKQSSENGGAIFK